MGRLLERRRGARLRRRTGFTEKAEPPFTFLPFGSSPTLHVGLRGYWTMDEATGLVRADSYLATPHDLTPGGAVPPTGVAGHVSGAANFPVNPTPPFESGTLDNDLAGDLHTTGDYSIAGWIKPDSVVGSGTNGFFSFRDTEGAQDLIRIWQSFGFEGGGILGVDHYDGVMRTDFGRLNLASAKWVFFVARFDAAAGQLWIEHANEDESWSAALGSTKTTGVGALASPSGECRLRFQTGSFKPAKVDEWGWWHKKLSDAEAAHLFNDGDGRSI